ncbi:hypothetical protein SAMN05216167_106163 [Spirosoma endophyticum]|uniref:Uncharacterized protein n=1 Tax=Spirosoma endophyticum TaxID=662367 RepID=A0A1I1U7Y0_9BACT|nr:hypothetical protein SAMN05216167_106163 [Spirosoma endophyticum]
MENRLLAGLWNKPKKKLLSSQSQLDLAISASPATFV